MYWIRVLNLLHILNVRDRHKSNDGNLGNYANIVADNIDRFCFHKQGKIEYDSLIKSLSDYRCVTYTAEGDRIKSVRLTHIGSHYISYIFLAFCRSVALPITVSIITSIITVRITLQ